MPDPTHALLALGLALLALLLAGPLPFLLSRVPGARATPAAALILWQALAVGGILAAGAAVLQAVRASSYVAGWFALGLGALVLGRLLWSGHVVGRELRILRRRHRAQVDLLARVEAGGLRVLDHDAPIAYCLPGMRSYIVVSAGALTQLSPEQFDGVLAHERAHVRARHDLVIEAFTVLRRAFPQIVTSRAALRETRLLIEVLADRAGARRSSPRAMGEAMVALARVQPGPQAHTLGMEPGADLSTRLGLVVAPRHAGVRSAALVLAAAVAVLTPVVLALV